MKTITLPLPINKHLFLSIDFMNNKICKINYCRADNIIKRSDSSTKDDILFAKKIANELECYFKHANKQFTLPCDLQQGTPFQQKVWQALLAIQPGEVKTYGALAKELNSSARAIGNACRRNLFPVVIPCHRVISASGIGGYAGDTLLSQQGEIDYMQIKQYLLAHENVFM